jgi:lipoyl(octanoyl) transferase
MSTPAQPSWRLLDTGPADGFTNMAVDEALLETYAAHAGSPTLRFYTWSPPALSLGYGQPLTSDIDLSCCQALGIDVVRRPTGGRAVLHDREVTYSVIIREDDPLAAAGVLASYLTISRALIRGLSYLGIDAELLPLRRPVPSEAVSPVCFATPSSYEVAVAGRKIIGSAQRRAHGAIMQHGSLPLAFDRETLRRVFAVSQTAPSSAAAERSYHTAMTSLQEAGGRQFTYAEVVAALSRGFADTWQVTLMADQLTAEERRLSAHLRATKYGSASWTWHR